MAGVIRDFSLRCTTAEKELVDMGPFTPPEGVRRNPIRSQLPVAGRRVDGRLLVAAACCCSMCYHCGVHCCSVAGSLLVCVRMSDPVTNMHTSALLVPVCLFVWLVES
jgi:hypothetical protein